MKSSGRPRCSLKPDDLVRVQHMTGVKGVSGNAVSDPVGTMGRRDAHAQRARSRLFRYRSQHSVEDGDRGHSCAASFASPSFAHGLTMAMTNQERASKSTGLLREASPPSRCRHRTRRGPRTPRPIDRQSRHIALPEQLAGDRLDDLQSFLAGRPRARAWGKQSPKFSRAGWPLSRPKSR
jgi:hypothetical protein